MGIRERFTAVGAYFYLERPVRNQSYADLGRDLAEAGEKILARLQSKRMTEFNHRVLSHIIGIERWGQSRLRALLGGPLLQDEYNGYRPARDVDWDALIEQFRATRAETVAIAQALETASVGHAQTVPHNEFGPLSARAWLRYLQTHASREIYQVR
ncbi:MAG: hypothetical protein DWI57_11820 [Chloroflexi bacterium]|nr:MAG: hypothetical protein DWI57_11820 [Chloroflexota bacterium]